jgi:hypothetical protein
MKQAILVTAYKDLDKLKGLIEFFDDDFYFYIHIDKKTQASKEEIERLKNYKNVKYVSQEYTVNWGGQNHIKSILLLSKEALKNQDVEYIHYITAQDYPVKTPKEIKNILTINRGTEFLENFELPSKKYWLSENGGMDRIDYFNFYDLLNAKVKIEKIIIKVLMIIQKKLNLFKRSRKCLPPKLYGGSTYWTLTQPCLKYAIDYVENNPYYLKRFEHTFAPDEIFFHTIIMNSPFAKKVINKNLRYIDWNLRNGSMPAFLDESDYDKIVDSEYIFARKFDPKIAEKLLYLLNKKLAQDKENEKSL